MDTNRPNIIRRLYNWVLHWAETPYGTPALVLNSFAESSFFPIPPDVLLIALALGKPKRAWWYAFVSTSASVIGGIAGYYIGYALWASVGEPIVQFYNAQPIFDSLFAKFAEYSFWAILVAAITPIPYKIFTITAGVVAANSFGAGSLVPDAAGVLASAQLNTSVASGHTAYFITFILASIIGRSIRFFGISALIYFFGQRIKSFIDRYFNLLSIAFVVLLAAGFYLISRLT